MKDLLKILRYAIPYWSYVSLNILFNVLSVVFSLFSLTMIIPFLSILFDRTKLVTDATPFAFNVESITANFNFIISKIIIEQGQIKALLFISILVVILFLLKNLFRYLGMFFLAPVRNGVIEDLRNDIYKKILILPLSYFNEQKKGDIMSRMTNDVKEIEWSIMTSIEMIFREPLTIISFVITLFIISPQLTITVMVMLPLAGIIIARVGKSLRKTSLKSQQKMGGLMSLVEESISGLRVIKGFNAIDITNKRFSDTNRHYTRLMTKLYRKWDMAGPLSEFLGVLVMVVIIWYGGQLVLNPKDSLSAEVFIFYVAVFSQLIQPAKAFTTAFYNIQKGVASVERISEIINAEEIIEEQENPLPIKTFEKYIEYRNITFAYEKDIVLDNLNLIIQKGKTIAIVGPSGAGKSTMADLLPRFYDPTKGEIIIDDLPIKECIISDVRGLMGIVNQETILFNDNVFNNIAFGMQGVTIDDVIAAAKVANAHEFIEKMELGYYTNIGDRGGKLSGGQRQRISIARAVLKNPPILILDEATSALDTESEKLVQESLTYLMKNRTSIVIAHRLSTIRQADEIIVLQKGVIVERGNHDELIMQNGVYSKLVELQAFH